MLSKLFLLVLLVEFSVSAQTPTYSSVGPHVSPRIAALGKQVRSGDRGAVERFWKEVRKSGTPLIESIPGEKRDSLVTFLWRGSAETHNVVIFDGVAGFDAKDRMVTLDRTDVWYKTYKIRNDARFTYNLSPNDTLESFDDIKGDEAMNKRLAILRIDPLNPHRCPATFGAHTAQSSYVELPDAPPLLWNAASTEPQQGTVEITAIQSGILKDEKKVWIYTPSGFSKGGDRYPLLVLFDGDRNVMWVPEILDNLIAKKQIPPMVAILIDNSTPSVRRTQLPCDPAFADFLAKELVPWSRERYRTTQEAARTVVAGSSFGGLASVFAGLRHSEVFGNVVSLSGSFWWKPKVKRKGNGLQNRSMCLPDFPCAFVWRLGSWRAIPCRLRPTGTCEMC